jgi:hypothetical protein
MQSQEKLTEQRLILDVDGGSILDCRSGIGRGDESIILNIDSKPNLASLVFFSLYLGPPSGNEQ